ncbi:MAG TPA: 16S rRNA (uracil(1498)-N(3))-methyltransferase [Burkholderiaceae bacterium]|nr:16S rRNA (uracil(1498)-N(3))-methyltransferase [Burkholderiaceae bacterium]
MTGPRFFIDAEFLIGDTVTLPARVAHHAQHVLRLVEGDPITLINGRGGEYGARLLDSAPAAAIIETFDPVDRESPLAVTLVQALVAAEKLEWIIEKTTEVGAARIVIAPASRSTVKLVGDRVNTRVARWNEIAIAACCQCGRNRPPAVLFLPTLSTALALAADSAAKWIFAPGASSGLRVKRSTPSMTVAVGPEGDWTDQELSHAERLGYARALFGPRVLRAETAGVAIIAALQAAAGDLDLGVA